MPASAPGSPEHACPARPDTACRLRAIPRRAPPLPSRSRGRQYDLPDRGLPNRNIAATEPRAHIGQASDFSPI